MLSQLVGIVLSVYSLVSVVVDVSARTKIALALVAFILSVLPLLMQLYFFIQSARNFGFGFWKYVLHQVLKWVTDAYYDEMLPYFYVKLPPIFSFSDPFGHRLKADYMSTFLTMSPDVTNTGEVWDDYRAEGANENDWVDASTNLHYLTHSVYATDFKFWKIVRNCILSCETDNSSNTITVVVKTLDGLELHSEKCTFETSLMDTFRILSKIFDDMEKYDLYIVDDLRGLGEKGTHLCCTSIRSLMDKLSHGATMTKVTGASKKYIRLG